MASQDLSPRIESWKTQRAVRKGRLSQHRHGLACRPQVPTSRRLASHFLRPVQHIILWCSNNMCSVIFWMKYNYSQSKCRILVFVQQLFHKVGWVARMMWKMQGQIELHSWCCRNLSAAAICVHPTHLFVPGLKDTSKIPWQLLVL